MPFPAYKTVTNKLVAKDRNNLLRALNEAMLSGTPKLVREQVRFFGEIDAAKKKLLMNY